MISFLAHAAIVFVLVVATTALAAISPWTNLWFIVVIFWSLLGWLSWQEERERAKHIKRIQRRGLDRW